MHHILLEKEFARMESMNLHTQKPQSIEFGCCAHYTFKNGPIHQLVNTKKNIMSSIKIYRLEMNNDIPSLLPNLGPFYFPKCRSVSQTERTSCMEHKIMVSLFIKPKCNKMYKGSNLRIHQLNNFVSWLMSNWIHEIDFTLCG